MVFTTVIYLRFLSVTIPIFAIGNYYKIKELFQDEKKRDLYLQSLQAA